MSSDPSSSVSLRELAFTHAEVAVALLDGTGRFIEVNEACCRLLGRERAELLSLSAGVLSHPEDRARESATFNRMLAGDLVTHSAECRAVLKDGSLSWVRFSARVVVYASGAFQYFVSTLEKIERQKDLESLLQESRVHLEDVASVAATGHQILDSLPDLVFLKGPRSELRWANKSSREFYGMSNEQLQGLLDSPFNEPDYTLQYIKDDLQVFTTGQPLEIPQEPVRRYDGVVRLFNTVKSPIRNKQGEVVMTVGISRDITERKEAEKALEQQRVRLAASAKMSALGEMSGGIAHEINNPLAIILGKTAQMKRDLQEGKVEREGLLDGVIRIEATASRIAKIVRGLRTFSRSSEQDPPIEVGVVQLMEDTLELCKERFRHDQILLQVGDVPACRVECRPSQISQVLLNLLNNARDAVLGQPNAEVRIEVEATGERVKFLVTDSGKGIPAAVVSRMMEPFFTTKEIGKGTGLGLSIAKGIVDDHHGILSFDSTWPTTRFILELPLKQPPRPAGGSV